MKEVVSREERYGLLGRLDFGFSETPSKEAAIREFRVFFGNTKAFWFLDLLEYLSEVRKEFKITDIYLTEGKPVMVGKPLMPLTAPVFQAVLPKLKRDDILSIVKTFMGTSKEGVYKLVRDKTGGVDFSFAIYGIGAFRCNFSVYEGGVNLTIRWLDFEIPSFEELNYHPLYIKFINSLLNKTTTIDPFTGREVEITTLKRGGLILHCGETSSGKTTSIAAEMKFLADNLNGIILTYENPIEYRFASTKAPVIQYNIEKHFNNSFEGVLKHISRNAPTVAFVEGVKSIEEIDALIDIASRGHLIFSTMHAGSIEEVFEILLKLVGKESKVASTLLSVMVHKLEFLPDPETKRMEIIPVYETLILHPEIMGKSPALSLYSAIDQRSMIKIRNALGETSYYISRRRYVKECVPPKFKPAVMARLGEEG